MSNEINITKNEVQKVEVRRMRITGRVSNISGKWHAGGYVKPEKFGIWASFIEQGMGVLHEPGSETFDRIGGNR